jgi:hypothetical protein
VSLGTYCPNEEVLFFFGASSKSVLLDAEIDPTSNNNILRFNQ